MLKPLLIALAAAALSIAQPAAAQAPGPRVTVEQGVLQGAVDQGVPVFRGVPFAAPPVGRLRWAPPVAAPAWTGVREASRFGASCPQALAPGGRDPWTTEYMAPAEPGISEDCLFLNIWTPATPGARPAGRLPVLLFIHGGGYNEGAGSVAVYNGARLAKKGVVVVNLNYRLRLLGFMAHPQLTAEQGGASGDYGIQDQIAALQWIRANIAAFGGDPGKVTIAGQSAGAGSVMSLLVSPAAKGLFRAAILQSTPGPGTNGNYPSLATAEQQGVAALAQMGAADIAAARALPFEKVLAAPGRAAPIADGRAIPAAPNPPPLASNVPVMIGYTLNDLFGSRSDPVTAAAWRAEAAERYGDQAAEFLRFYPGETDRQATYSAHRESADRLYGAKMVEWLDRRGATAPVFGYLFSHVEPGPQSARWGAFHTSEVPYEFDTLALSPNRAFTDVDRALAGQFSSYVANFVKTGDPNGAGLPRWAALTPQSKAIMELGDEVRLSRASPAGAEAILAAGKPPTSTRPAPAAAPAPR